MNWKDDAARAWDVLEWDGQVQWFAKGPRRVSGGRLHSKDALIRCVDNMARLGLNLYVGLNPSRRCGVKARREDILFWRYILVDLDPLPCPRGTNRHVRDMESLLRPAHNLYSGRGWQWWLELEPLDLRHEDRFKVERGTKAFLANLEEQCALWKWRVDQTTSDLARIARCPGSVNQRTGERARFVSFASGQSRDPGTVIALAPPPPERQGLIDGDISDLRDVLPHLKGRAREFLVWGVGEGGRHSACWHTAKALWESGAARERAVEWLALGAERCSPPLPGGDVERVIREVWQ